MNKVAYNVHIALQSNGLPEISIKPTTIETIRIVERRDLDIPTEKPFDFGDAEKPLPDDFEGEL